MIKKIFSSLLLIGIGFLGFSYAGYMTGQNGMYIFDVNQPTVLGNYTFEFSNNGNLSTTLNGDSGNFIYQALNNSPYTLHNFYGWYNGKLYYYSKSSYDNSRTQGFIDKWCVGDSYEYCKNGNYNYDTQYVIDNIGNISKVLYGTISLTWGVIGGDNINTYVCFYDGTYYCASCNKSDYSSCLSKLTGESLNLNESSINGFNSINWSSSPFYVNPNSNIPSTGSFDFSGYVYDTLVSGDYVSYYENIKGFNKDMCYVGTTDLNSNYEDGIPYYQGSGYTIFDTYSKLFNTTSFTIRDTGRFLYVWLMNFNEWFPGPGHIIYRYGDLPIYDTGSGLTNPFLNNKAVYYFIGSTFWDFNNNPYSQGDMNSIGDSLATYCYYKLQSKSNVGENLNVGDDHSSAVDDNVAKNKVNQSHTSWVVHSGTIIDSQSWHGTPLDYFTGGDDIKDFKTFFNIAFNRFKVSYGTLNASDLGVGVLPGYIALFLLAVILFKFLRK